MYQHHTKSLGDLGVLKAQLDLFQKGYLICQPMTEHAPFDLVAYKDGEFKRIQVKARSLKDNRVKIEFRNSHCNSSGVVTKKVDKNEIDIYCIYIPETDKCYYINPKDFDSTVWLRHEPPKNNQVKGINFLKDYEEMF